MDCWAGSTALPHRRVQYGAVCCSVLQCVAVLCSVLQCVALCCSVLQCVAVCCGVLQFGVVVAWCIVVILYIWGGYD